MTMPPTHMIGADTIIVQVSSTSICTCCTSLVVRVMSDGAPKLVDLAGRERADPVEHRGAGVAAEAHRGARAEVDGVTSAMTWTTLTASITPPTRTM